MHIDSKILSFLFLTGFFPINLHLLRPKASYTTLCAINLIFTFDPGSKYYLILSFCLSEVNTVPLAKHRASSRTDPEHFHLHSDQQQRDDKIAEAIKERQIQGMFVAK